MQCSLCLPASSHFFQLRQDTVAGSACAAKFRLSCPSHRTKIVALIVRPPNHQDGTREQTT